MKSQLTSRKLASAIVILATAGPAYGQVLYQQNFDLDDTLNWHLDNPTVGFDGAATVVKPQDGFADVFYDYSQLPTAAAPSGIPSAPNSTGGTTRGLKVQANLFSDALGGYSVSPMNQTFTGNYSMTFDLWANSLGPWPGGGSGSTNLSSAGILTSGTVSNTVAGGDGVWFMITGDGNSTADYRAYSVERTFSYQTVPTTPNPQRDAHATHHFLGNTGTALTANNSDFDDDLDVDGTDFLTWQRGYGVITAATEDDGNANADTAVDDLDYNIWRAHYGGTPFDPTRNMDLNTDLLAAFPGQPQPAAQTTAYPAATGTMKNSAIGFAWHEVEIRKVGMLVEWYINGLKMITVDLTNFEVPTGGTNISFGHGDINAGSSTAHPAADDLLFTLIDNVVVTQLPASAAAAGSIPEPANWCSAVVAALACLAAAAPRRQLARVTVRN